MRILYVEDNEANASLVRRVASAGNHEFVTYSDAETALKNFNQVDPHLVLVDIHLPGPINGLEFIRHIRKAGHTLPIVVITAHATEGERGFYMDIGCDDFIIKPAPIHRLVELLEAAV